MRTSLIFILSLFIGSLYGFGQDQDGKDGASTSGNTSTISLVRVSDQIYMFKGKGGNIGVHYGDDGVLMIDSQFAEVTPEILGLVSSFSDKPIQFLVNTHHHGDHTGGNKNMIANGTVVLSHENARTRMVSKERAAFEEKQATRYETAMAKFSKEGNSEEAERNTKESMKDDTPFKETPYIYPTMTFSDDMTFYYNGEKIMVFHVHKAHTDGDAMVYFTQSNVLHTGDVFFNGKYPFIDTKNGGTYDGYLKALSQVLYLIDDDTKIIPGHGTVGTKQDLKKSHDMMVAVKNSVAFHFVAGKTKEQILGMKEITEAYDNDDFGSGYISTERWLTLVYDTVKKKYGKGKK